MIKYVFFNNKNSFINRFLSKLWTINILFGGIVRFKSRTNLFPCTFVLFLRILGTQNNIYSGSYHSIILYKKLFHLNYEIVNVYEFGFVSTNDSVIYHEQNINIKTSKQTINE